MVPFLNAPCISRVCVLLSHLEIFYKCILDLGAVIVGNARGRAFNFLHQPVKVIARGRYADNADSGAIPQLCAVEFGYGHIEAGTQTIFHAAHNLAAILKGLCSFDVEFEREECDGHRLRVSAFEWAGALPTAKTV